MNVFEKNLINAPAMMLINYTDLTKIIIMEIDASLNE